MRGGFGVSTALSGSKLLKSGSTLEGVWALRKAAGQETFLLDGLTEVSLVGNLVWPD